MIGARACRWHGSLIPDADAVLVGALERGSGAPLLVYACTDCAADLDLLPLAEHPDGADGSPQTRAGRPVHAPHTTAVLCHPVPAGADVDQLLDT